MQAESVATTSSEVVSLSATGRLADVFGEEALARPLFISESDIRVVGIATTAFIDPL